jgi:hypothetical protein
VALRLASAAQGSHPEPVGEFTPDGQMDKVIYG